MNLIEDYILDTIKKAGVWVIVIMAALSLTAEAQTTVIVQPDCQIFFNLSAAGSGTAYDNRFTGCSYWSISYNSSGFSALTLTVQSAPNNAGVPGTWATFVGSTAVGSNPMTSTTSTYSIYSGYNPFVRVNLSGTTGTGVVGGTVYGWRQIPTGSSGGPSSTVTANGPDAPGSPSTANPVQTAGNDGTNVRAIRTDTTGRTVSVGAAADGAAAAGNPVLVAGFDGTNAQSISTNSSGQVNVVCISGCSGGGGGGTVVGPDASGSPSTGNPVQMAGNDGTDVRSVRTDTTGRVVSVGAAADGAAAAGNPLLVAGFDGTNAQSISTNASGQVNVVCVSGCGGGGGSSVVTGPDAPGAASTGNPVQMATNDGTNVQALRSDTSGRPIVVGAAAAGAAIAGNPVLMGGTDSGTTRALALSSGGNVLLGITAVALTDGLTNTQSTVRGTGGTQAAFVEFPYILNSGGSWDRQYKCDQSAAISLSASGNTQIVALSASTRIRICHISLGPASVVAVKLTYGTGTNCGTGTTDLTGTYQAATQLALDFASPSPLVLPFSQALCVNLGSAVSTGGVITYARF